MDMRAINYFISVFEHRSFTKAAERMHVVQSALSMRIRNLEEQLGSPLFERTPSGLVPTRAGQHLYDLCIPISRSISAAKQEMDDLKSGKSKKGLLRIGITSPMCRNVLGNVLPQFMEMYPDFEIAVSEGYSREITEEVQAGKLDVGLGALPLGDSSLTWTHGFSDRYVVVSGRPIHGPTLTPVELSQLTGSTLVVPTARHLMRQRMDEHIASGRLKPKKIVTVTGMVATLESVRDTDWAAICLMNSVLERIGDEKTYIYPIVNPTMYFDLYILHDVHRPLDIAARQFVDMFRARLTELKSLWSNE
ncbi:LysR family transcriptional regulator [Bradyrhizobium vignae]|uniref:Putative Regulatory protein, LysR:LysR, substrate-binding n=1 Tax=Bradyrhizobium vignae TaxID=1549949 RepID=A0A2U3PUX3_9BRAD|nr:LysR family transcriptional regulator [Bradyrhizobium vignae]SPP92919.1 putative Regulatory protein, LysR:LysR, substrate-binding [Bradyrhizobium vignae]